MEQEWNRGFNPIDVGFETIEQSLNVQTFDVFQDNFDSLMRCNSAVG